MITNWTFFFLKPLNLDQQQALENNIMTNLGEEKFMLCMCMHIRYFTKTLWPSCLRQNKNNFQDQALQLSVVTLIGGTINVWFFMYVLVLCIFLMSFFLLYKCLMCLHNNV